MERASHNKWVDGAVRFIQKQRALLIGYIYIYSARSLKQQSVGRHVALLYSGTLSWFRANQFLVLLLKAMCVAEK